MAESLDNEEIRFILDVLNYAKKGYNRFLEKYSNIVEFVKVINPTNKMMFERVEEKLRKMLNQPK